MEISLLNHNTDTCPRTITLEQVVEMIRSSSLLEQLTTAHRQDPQAGHKDATPLIVVPGIVENGKRQADIVRMTGLSLVDFDHLDRERLLQLRERARADPHTLVFYGSISGKGGRVIFCYELDDSYELKQQKLFYPKAFAYGNEYYQKLLGAEADSQCKNVGRTSILAYDPDVYYNPHAIPFTSQEIQTAWKRISNQQKQKKKHDAAINKIEKLYNETILHEVESEGVVYQPGAHNDFVMRVGYKLNQFGIKEEYAQEWAARKFPDYEKAESVVGSCYAASADEFASRGGQKRNWAENAASFDEIEDFIKKNIELRRNIIIGRIECRWKKADEEWRVYTDVDENSLYRKLGKIKHVRAETINKLVNSDLTQNYHPFKAYLDGLPEWDGNTDYIRELASTVTVSGGESAQEFFYECLRKWLVGLIAGWVDKKEVNHLMLILIGRQGSNKTTWFNFLLPPELESYSYIKINAWRSAKDDLTMLAKYALICCEELDAMNPEQLNNMKASITTPTVDERQAYQRYSERRKHVASFCGTGNNLQMLTDTTGNRRWMPFEAVHIKSPRKYPFNHQGIYSQAYALYKNNFQYWMDDADSENLKEHNELFQVADAAEDLIQAFFGLPGENQIGEFISTGEALSMLPNNNAHKLNIITLGRAFTRLGFKPDKVGKRRGYRVLYKTEDVRRRERYSLAYEALKGEPAPPETDETDIY